MATIGNKALTYLPELIVAVPAASASIESFKGMLYKIAEFQKEGSANKIFTGVKVSRKNPYISSEWRMENGDFAAGTVTLAGVLAADTVTVNGLVYTAVAGAKANNTQFSIDGTDTVDAADLTDSINNDTRTGTLDDVVATSAAAVVTMQSTVPGTGGNATTLVSSTGVRLAVSGATFGGGSADPLVTTSLVSETTLETAGVKGRAGLSSRRPVSIGVVNNGNTYTVRSILGAVAFIEGLEDKVAQSGVSATGDGTYTDQPVPVFTPFDSFEWTIVKLADAYTLTPTANS